MPDSRSRASPPTPLARPPWTRQHPGHAAPTRRPQASLGEAGVSCTGLHVNVDLGDYQPGGQLRVTVSCHAHLSDVALAGFPGSRTFTATSTVPIETYRTP